MVSGSQLQVAKLAQMYVPSSAQRCPAVPSEGQQTQAVPIGGFLAFCLT